MPTHILAQSTWLPPTDNSLVSVEVYKPKRPVGSIDANGTVIFLTALLRKPSGLTFVFEMPIAHSNELDLVSIGRRNSQTAVGNPYFGISFRGNQSATTTLDVGIRFPLASDDQVFARSIGMETDFDRWEAFLPDQFTLRTLIGGFWSKEDSPHAGWIKGGGTLLVANEIRDLEFLADFRAGLWFNGNKVAYGFTLIGRTLLTERGLSLSERNELLLGFGFNINLGPFKPGVHAHVPLTDNGLFRLGQRLSSVIGANVTLLLGSNNQN